MQHRAIFGGKSDTNRAIFGGFQTPNFQFCSLAIHVCHRLYPSLPACAAPQTHEHGTSREKKGQVGGRLANPCVWEDRWIYHGFVSVSMAMQLYMA